jgi:hypothetical protein
VPGIPLDGRRKSSTQGHNQPPVLSNGGNHTSQEARGYNDICFSQSAPKPTLFDPCAENGNSPSRPNNTRRPDSFEKPSTIQAPESTPGTTLDDRESSLLLKIMQGWHSPADTEVLNTAGRTMPFWEVLEISENTCQLL